MNEREINKMERHRRKLNKLVEKYGTQHKKVLDESHKLDYYIARYCEEILRPSGAFGMYHIETKTPLKSIFNIL